MTVSPYEPQESIASIEQFKDLISLDARARLSNQDTPIWKIPDLRKMLNADKTVDVEALVKAGTLDAQTAAEMFDAEAAAFYEVATRRDANSSLRGIIFIFPGHDISPFDLQMYARVMSSGSKLDRNFAELWARKADDMRLEYMAEQG